MADPRTDRERTWPGNDGEPLDHDPRHGAVDRDIQWAVQDMAPRSLGSRVAIENTLQERRDRADPRTDRFALADDLLRSSYETSPPQGRGATEEGEKDGQHTRVRPDEARRPAQGPDETGLQGGPGVPDCSGPDPARRLPEGAVRELGGDGGADDLRAVLGRPRGAGYGTVVGEALSRLADQAVNSAGSDEGVDKAVRDYETVDAALAPAPGGGLAARIEALADGWDGGEENGIEHVVDCEDFGCKTCVVVACAADLRAVLDVGRAVGREKP